MANFARRAARLSLRAAAGGCQIAWFTGEQGTSRLSMAFVKAGNFDFINAAMPSRALTKTQLSWRISDHYPLWAEFAV